MSSPLNTVTSTIVLNPPVAISGEFKESALPEADITAFVRDVKTEPGYFITVMWKGQDQVRDLLYGG